MSEVIARLFELFQPYARTEFERSERLENGPRRRREAWLAAHGVGVGVGVGEVD